MDAQALIDMASEVRREERQKYHLTLGQLLDRLEAIKDRYEDADTEVEFDVRGWPGVLHPHPKYPTDLAFASNDTFQEYPTVGLLIQVCKGTIGKMAKIPGGSFLIGRDTPLWRSVLGGSEARAIVGISREPGRVTLHTKDVV